MLQLSLLFLLLGTAFAPARETSLLVAEERPKVALVLGGGGAKAAAHLAVLELIEEMDIPLDMVFGISGGSLLAGLYCAGYTPEMLKDIMFDLDWIDFSRDKPVSPFEEELGTQNLPLRLRVKNGLSPDFDGGYSNGEAAYAFLKSLTAKIPSYMDFDELPVPFRTAAVEASEGKLEMIGQGDLAEVIRASISLPGAFEPFFIDGKRYIDGGVRNILPIREAREMGYDIVIAVELFPDVEIFDSPPLAIPEQLLGLFFYSLSEGQYPYADAVLTPPVREFSILDFNKSREIYSAAMKDHKELREKLEMIRGKIYPPAPSADDEVPAQPTRQPPRTAYSELPSIVPQRLTIAGGLPSDRKYIENSFSRLLQGKPLDQDKLSVFIDRIYGTGHYRFVVTRTDIRSGEPCLELILYPENLAKTLILAGGTYQGTMTSDSINTIALGVNLQFRGLSGPGSALSLGTSWKNNPSLDLLYLQPLSQRVFISANGGITIDQLDIEEPDILSVLGKIKMGILFDNYHTLNFGPAVVYLGEEEKTALCFITSYRLSSLDYQVFAARGIYAKIENAMSFPLPATMPVEAGFIYDTVSLDVSAAIPLNSYFSIITSLFASTGGSLDGYSEAASSGINQFLGFNTLERMYFPHLSGKPIGGAGSMDGGVHKVASLLILQYQPWKNLTILGGQVFFSVSAAAGQIVSEWEQFIPDNLIWNASFNAGLRMGKTFGLRFKGGAGSFNPRPIAPFFSIDIGFFRY
jgi:NTE family protein